MPIPICDKSYLASDYGNIYSIKKNIIKKIKQCINDKYGTLVINLMNNKKSIQYKVHYLILLSFVGERPDNMDVRHLNGNPKDNRLINLKYGTRKENAHDAIIHGTSARGSKNGNSKLKKKDVFKIRNLYKTGKYTQKELGKMFNVSREHARDIINNKYWEWLQ